MSIGLVKWFNCQKGYGSIQPQDGSKEVPVHISAVEHLGLDQLVAGDRISYRLERSQQDEVSAVDLRLTPQQPLPTGSAGDGASRPLQEKPIG
jgi:cold shock protein